MNNRKKIILFILSAYMGLTLLREMGYVNLNLYTSEYKINLTENFQTNTTTAKFSLDRDEDWMKVINSKCNFQSNLSNVPILVTYKNQKFGDTSDCKFITIQITELNVGALWLPLYKSSDISGKANFNSSIGLYSFEKNRLVQALHQLSGNIAITGHITVKGISSYKNAKQLVIDAVLKQIYSRVKEKIKQL